MDNQLLINAKDHLLNAVNIAQNKLFGYQIVHLGTKTNQSEKTAFQDQYQPLERLFVWFQRIVLWHEPLKSAITITGLVSTFLLSSQYELQFIPCMMMGFFIYNLFKVWFEHIWPEIRVPPQDDQEFDKWTHLHPQFLTLTEFNTYIGKLTEYMHNQILRLGELRFQSPVLFCSITCTLLLITKSFGQIVSGFTLLFTLFVIVLISPGIYLHLLPRNAKSYIRRINFIIFDAQSTTMHNIDSSAREYQAKNIATSMETDISENQQIIQEQKSKSASEQMSKQLQHAVTSIATKLLHENVRSQPSSEFPEKSVTSPSSSSIASSGDLLNSDESLMDLEEEDPNDGFIII